MRKKKKKDNLILSRYIKKILIKSMVCMLLFLLFLIGIKKIEGFESTIYNNVYSKSITFAKINSWYEKHFGNLFPIKNVDDVLVFNETISYDKKEKYLDGVKLSVTDNYLVPSINNGIIVYIGDKDNYGKTVIVEDEEGLDTWYSNIKVLNINMYDYVKKGDYLGEVIDNNLIMVFQKDGQKEDYTKYI